MGVSKLCEDEMDIQDFARLEPVGQDQGEVVTLSFAPTVGGWEALKAMFDEHRNPRSVTMLLIAHQSLKDVAESILTSTWGKERPFKVMVYRFGNLGRNPNLLRKVLPHVEMMPG